MNPPTHTSIPCSDYPASSITRAFRPQSCQVIHEAGFWSATSVMNGISDFIITVEMLAFAVLNKFVFDYQPFKRMIRHPRTAALLRARDKNFMENLCRFVSCTDVMDDAIHLGQNLRGSAQRLRQKITPAHCATHEEEVRWYPADPAQDA